MESKSQKSNDEKFKSNFLALMEGVKQLISYAKGHGHSVINPSYLEIGIKLLESKNTHENLKFIRSRSFKYWKLIKERKESFFLDNAKDIFSDFQSPDSVDLFKTLFTAKTKDGKLIIGDANKTVIWDRLNNMVINMIKYSLEYKDMDVSEFAKLYGLQ